MNDATFEVRSEAPPVTLVGVRGVAGRMDAEFFRPVFVRNEAKLRSGRFSVARLGDLILKGNYGSLPDSGDYSNSGVPLIRGTDLRSMLVTLEAAVRVPETYLDKFKKAQVQPGDLLMLAKGASLDRPDSVAMYPLDGPTALANGSIFVMRPDRKRVNPFFLLGYLASNALLLQKRRASTNTGALYNDIGSISGFLVPLPDRRIQDFIGAKVELAERCRAVSTRCESKSSELLRDGLGQSIDDILKTLPVDGVLPTGAFATLVDADLLRGRLDPSGYHPTLIALQAWASTNKSLFTPLGKLVTAETSKRSRVGKDCSFFVSVLHLNDRGFVDKDGARAYRPESGGREARSMDVLVSCINPAANRVGVCDFPDEAGGCSPEFSILRARNGVDPNYVAFALRTELCRTQLLHLGRGTSSSRRRVDENELLDVLVPTVECASAIAKTVRRGHFLSAAAIRLINEAKADVEALIEGTLDVQAILSGTLKAPSADDIPELAEEGA